MPFRSLRTASRSRHTARVRPGLVLGHGFGGATIRAGKALLLRDPCRVSFLLIRELCPAIHIVSLPRPNSEAGDRWLG